MVQICLFTILTHVLFHTGLDSLKAEIGCRRTLPVKASHLQTETSASDIEVCRADQEAFVHIL